MRGKRYEMLERSRNRHGKDTIPLPFKVFLLLGFSPLLLLAIGGNMIYKAIRKKR